MGFSRQECWSGLLFPSPGDLPDPGIEPVSSAVTGDFFPTEPSGKPILIVQRCYIKAEIVKVGRKQANKTLTQAAYKGNFDYEDTYKLKENRRE